ncbi:hypothetical protein SKAU_G00327420 [Synaphobranchus kaupii]|uniref:Chordin-like protein 1/2 C-terminal domain-containing protein n=1 Tax=Synaphobranchus kaupii TaxID=118154 RepID=A0A9Q1EQ16_SYNKA|nr:hypothetical protein SKAU_G00327420 [Synaphobranchus kaupii]
MQQNRHQRACVYSGKNECKRVTFQISIHANGLRKPRGKCCKTCPELKEETNRTRCLLEHDSNSLLVYKFEPASEPDTEGSVRIIAIERQGVTRLKYKCGRLLREFLRLMETGGLQKKDLAEHPENYILLTTLDEDTWKKFKEGGNKGKEFPKSRTCEEGIKEVVKFLNPEQLDSLCTI